MRLDLDRYGASWAGAAVFAFCEVFGDLSDTGEVRCWRAGLRHRSMHGMVELQALKTSARARLPTVNKSVWRSHDPDGSHGTICDVPQGPPG